MAFNEEQAKRWLEYYKDADRATRGRMNIVENATASAREVMLERALERKRIGKGTEATDNLINLLKFYSYIAGAGRLVRKDLDPVEQAEEEEVVRRRNRR